MKIYCFTSQDMQNIWAGVGAQKWAVTPNNKMYNQYKSKAKKMPIGAFGLFYCVKDQLFTTPFVVKSTINDMKESDIWKEEYELPFEIRTIGDPYKKIAKTEMQEVLKSNGGQDNWNEVFHLGGQFNFVSTEISDNDWQDILIRLM